MSRPLYAVIKNLNQAVIERTLRLDTYRSSNQGLLFTFNGFNVQKEEVEETEQRIEEDRTHHIDALIVRIMKAKKQMKHNELMADVMNGLLFNASPAAIKARIETLIDRGTRFEKMVSSYHLIGIES